MAGFERDAEHVGAVTFDALGHKADRGRDGFDTPGIEIGPDGARAGDCVAVGGDPALDRLVGRVCKREYDPVWIGGGERGADRHARDRAVWACRRFDLKAVAAPLIQLAERCDFDAVLVGRDDDGLQGLGWGGTKQHRHGDGDQRKGPEHDHSLQHRCAALCEPVSRARHHVTTCAAASPATRP